VDRLPSFCCTKKRTNALRRSVVLVVHQYHGDLLYRNMFVSSSLRSTFEGRREAEHIMISLIIAGLLLACHVGTSTKLEWETGNTHAVPHPDESMRGHSTIPTMLSRIEGAFESGEGVAAGSWAFRGPVAQDTWLVRNASHHWTVLHVAAAAYARLWLATLPDCGADITHNDVVQFISSTSWELCFAKEPIEGGIEYLDRCTAFRTRQGPVGLGVSTMHRVTVESSHGKRVHLTFMEESLQIFHPTETQQRIEFTTLLIHDFINEMRFRSSQVLSWSIGDAKRRLGLLMSSASGENHAALVQAGLRGISLLSCEEQFFSPSSSSQLLELRRGSVLSGRSEPSCSRHSTHGAHVCSVSSSVPLDAQRVAPFQSFQLGVASQNIWNFNGDWKYRRRALSLDLAQGIPFPVDIITLQEVRYHSNAPDTSPFPTCDPQTNGLDHASCVSLPVHSKTQALDMVAAFDHASASRISLGVDTQKHRAAHVKDFAFYPAMTYLHLSRYEPPRLEMEGLMNMVMKYYDERPPWFVVGHERHLLRRNTSDQGGDDHQRSLLCTILLCPLRRDGEYVDVRIDVCTSHFALGEAAQEQNVLEAIAFMDRLRDRRRFGDGRNTGEYITEPMLMPTASATFFTGDLNSEPHHTVATHIIASGFMDLWAACNGGSGSGGTVESGFTFNTNEETLVKRIDFIYLKMHDQRLSSHCVQFVTVGEGGVNRSRGVSSDHLGVAAHVKFTLR
jgi:endonuclease/exonuclease/phosphatase family metal-dependent hydrolase